MKNAAKRRKGKAAREKFKEAEENIREIQREIQADEIILKLWTTRENSMYELNCCGKEMKLLARNLKKVKKDQKDNLKEMKQHSERIKLREKWEEEDKREKQEIKFRQEERRLYVEIRDLIKAGLQADNEKRFKNKVQYGHNVVIYEPILEEVGELVQDDYKICQVVEVNKPYVKWESDLQDDYVEN